MALLRAPSLLLEWLTSQDVMIDVRQNAASELLVEVTKPEAAVDDALVPEPETVPEKKLEQRWAKALRSKRSKAWVAAEAAGAMTDKTFLDEAGKVVKEFKLNSKLRARVAAQLKFLTQGPSSRPLSDPELDTLRAGARSFLSQQQSGVPLDLMSFGLAVSRVSSEGGPLAVRGRLETEVRIAQLQTATVPFPAAGKRIDAQGAWCALNGQLPTSPGWVKGDQALCESVGRRRAYGRQVKTGYYAQILSDGLALMDAAKTREARFKTHDDAERDVLQSTLLRLVDGDLSDGFAEDFQDLTDNSQEDAPAALKASMAVISMDGNSFGKLRTAVVTEKGEAGLRAFSVWLEVRKALLMARILNWIADDPKRRTSQGKAAFEVLLWGGDELEFAMPGWVGWEFGLLLADELEKWGNPFGASELTFAIGLAFGKRKTPIRVLRRAAVDLSDMAKAASREETLFQVAAFESVDTVAMKPSACRKAQFGEGVTPADLALTSGSMKGAAAAAKGLYQQVGFSGLVRFMALHRDEFLTLSDCDPNVRRAAVEKLDADWSVHIERVGKGGSAERSVLPGLAASEGSHWFALVQGMALRDYLPKAEGEDQS